MYGQIARNGSYGTESMIPDTEGHSSDFIVL